MGSGIVHGCTVGPAAPEVVSPVAHTACRIPDEVAHALAQQAVDEQWAARPAEQAGWTEPGDYTRVQAAFDLLAADGILARMTFTCCPNCGHTEIADERSDEEAGTAVARASSLAVGRLVVRALRDQGLSVDWPEKTSARIAVTGLHWRKPLPPD